MLAILKFELRQKARSMSSYIYFLVFFSLALLWMAAAGGLFTGASIGFGGKVNINAPVAIFQSITFLGYLGISTVAALMGQATHQDIEHHTWHFFYSAPISKFQYLAGRFSGALLTSIIIFSGLGLGAWLGCYLPGIEAVRLGAVQPMSYVMPYLYAILPNFIIFGGIFFTLGALTRRMLPVYVASVLLIIGYLVARSLRADLDNKTLAALLDPFGSSAISMMTEYWSIADKNTRQIALDGVFLINRLIWLSLGLISLALCYWRFQFSTINTTGKQKKEKAVAAPIAVQLQKVTPNFSGNRILKLLYAESMLNLRESVKNVYFIVMLLAGVLFMFAISSSITKMFGTPTYPVTYAVLEILGGSFSIFMLAITTFYAGELVWRERDARIAQLLDALPVPNYLPFTAKLIALIALQGIMLFVLMLCGILLQTIKGYTNYELAQYVQQLFLMQWPDYALLAVLAISLQVIVNHKYLGYFLIILYYAATIALPAMGIEHPMFRYAVTPHITYSDMNAYGHMLATSRWYLSYWTGAALVLVSLSLMMWVRGTTTDFRLRLRLAKQAFAGGNSILLLGGTSIFVLTGAAIFYFTNILNPYQNQFAEQADNASYEKLYKQYAIQAQPRISDVKLNVDIYPETRCANIKGSYQLVNRSKQAIQEIFITQKEDIDIVKMEFDFATEKNIADKKLGFHSYKLKKPLAAGEKLTLNFELRIAPKNFLGMSQGSPLYYNGSFFNSMLMPHIGYQPALELREDKTRREHGLPEKERMAERDDSKALENSYIANDADWINFDAVVSTSADQMAVAPGTLKRQWQEHGRNYYHYVPELPILNFYAFLSGRYEVKQAQWQNIPIEIDYHKGHEYNVDRMVKGVQKSLDHYTKNFGPYQHKLVRIIEFPRYARFAQAFPNTIPFSESIGFIARVDDNNPKEVDYPFYVTAHEVAHQWWAHQVISGNSKGGTVLVETLAQYSALMVMKHTYGDATMRRFLQFELDRYLQGRSQERKKELPLAQNENQDYIHYAKGSLAMYLLQDQIGEDKVNQALREVIARHANKGAPYPSSKALTQALREVTPVEQQYVIDDLFDSITLYENRAISANATALPDGQYEVMLKVTSNKLKADELGAEKEVALKDWMDIGIDDKDGKPLLRQRHLINQKEMAFKLVVKGLPYKAGIDPDIKYIDRKPDDNLIKVELSNK
ncbi:ABC transporter permease/M1 family aminopeptidase [Undibacterium pigrum]|uniref:Peptidase M1-like protein n=1 Tax=Undibacterium pigrum TaxID=401470 RepID=A0A318JHZ4_9BURK|nr:M1 family aminopeptidase [Undibacterium pigrum]PXX47405.1 peptidase M1-like protein [Undibacterium pigrum]